MDSFALPEVRRDSPGHLRLVILKPVGRILENSDFPHNPGKQGWEVIRHRKKPENTDNEHESAENAENAADWL